MLSKRLLIFISFIFISFIGQSQDSSFRVIVSNDTISLQEIIQIEYIIENIEGQFIPPSFEDFTLLGGPNTMSSMSIINGQMTQKKSFSFVLKPISEGEKTIDSAQLKSANKNLETEPIKIFVKEDKSSSKPNKIEKIYNSKEQNSPKPKTNRPIKRI